MQSELIKVLEDIKETDLIETFLSNMTHEDISKLMLLLGHTDEETQKRWLQTYTRLLKVT